MSTKSNSTDLPASFSAYKPQILKIKITHFRLWIEKRLTELLDGLEDEILWSLVYNYLEAAQNRAKKEGPAANPSGGLKAEDIKTALSGFLGAKQATAFVDELFGLLKEAEENGTGIPAEFGMKPEEAVKEAFGIIEDKKKEMDLSQRVRREVAHTDRHNRRDYEQRERRGHGDSYESIRERHKHSEIYDGHRGHRSRSRSRNRRHSKSRSPSRGHYERRNDYYEDRSRYRERSRERSRGRSREDSDNGHSDRGYYRYSDDRGRSRELRHEPRHEHGRDPRYDRYRTSRTKSPIPSSSSSSASPSPGWESSLETSAPAAPRAPVSH